MTRPSLNSFSWEFPRMRGPHIDPKITPICRNSERVEEGLTASWSFRIIGNVVPELKMKDPNMDLW